MIKRLFYRWITKKARKASIDMLMDDISSFTGQPELSEDKKKAAIKHFGIDKVNFVSLSACEVAPNVFGERLGVNYNTKHRKYIGAHIDKVDRNKARRLNP